MLPGLQTQRRASPHAIGLSHSQLVSYFEFLAGGRQFKTTYRVLARMLHEIGSVCSSPGLAT